MARKKKGEDQSAKIREFTYRYLGKIRGWPRPEDKLVVLLDKQKTRVPCFIDENDQVFIRGEKNLYQDFVRYSELVNDPNFLFVCDQASKVAKQWLSIAETIDLDSIPTFKFKSEKGYCWNRIPFDPTPGPHPTWDSFCERVSNVEAFKKFTGSIFLADSYQQQYLVLYGAANSGKGAFLRALDKCFGDGAVSKYKSAAKADKHFFEDVVPARVVYFDDFDDTDMFSCGLFKSWTGGCRVNVDPKGKTPYQAQLSNKIIFTMNEPPQIKKAAEDMRRAILCEVRQVDEVSEEYEDQLWREMPAFVNSCISAIKGDRRKPIPVEESSFDAATEHDDVTCQYFWSKYFEIHEGAETLISQVHDVFEAQGIKNNKEKNRYYQYLYANTIAVPFRSSKCRKILNISKRKSPQKLPNTYSEDDPVKAEESFNRPQLSVISGKDNIDF